MAASVRDWDDATSRSKTRVTMKNALELTLRTIELRAKLYRRTVVITSALLVSLPLSGAVLRSWFPFLALILVVPVTATFCVLDNRQVCRWRDSILQLWTTANLDIASFSEFVSRNPMVPQQTFRAMIASLNQ